MCSTRTSTRWSRATLDLVVAGTGDAVLMVESEANELDEDTMLGAVMFGHRGMQPVINAIIKLAEVAANEPRDFQPEDLSALEGEMEGVAPTSWPRPYTITDKTERYNAVDAVKAEVKEALRAGRRRRRRQRTVRADRLEFKSLEAKVVRGNSSRPRPVSTAAIFRRFARSFGSRHPAAHPRFGSVHPRRNAGSRRSPRSAPAKTSSSSTL
jgi:polyribonucleotide nucleotidyltransferase